MPKNKPPMTVPSVPKPVMHGDAFRAFVAEATSIGNEVTARRAFDAEVGEYLKSKGLEADFNAWRAKKHTPPALKKA